MEIEFLHWDTTYSCGVEPREDSFECLFGNVVVPGTLTRDGHAVNPPFVLDCVVPEMSFDFEQVVPLTIRWNQVPLEVHGRISSEFSYFDPAFDGNVVSKLHVTHPLIFRISNERRM